MFTYLKIYVNPYIWYCNLSQNVSVLVGPLEKKKKTTRI